MTKLLVYLGIADSSSLRPWADEDNCEYRSVAKSIPIKELLKCFSFSSSWVPQAVATAKALGRVEGCSATVIFDDEAPHKEGDIVGEAICIGRFDYDTGAFRLDLPERHREELKTAELAAEVRDTILSGLDDLVSDRVKAWPGQSYSCAPSRVTDTAFQALQRVTDSDREELKARLTSFQTRVIALFQTVTTIRYRAWLTGDVLVALTPCSELSQDMPTDRIRVIHEPIPEGRKGIYFIGGIRPNRMICADEARNWRALLDELRTEWTEDCGWCNIGVVFSTREEALAIKEEHLRKPYVMGWYSHPCGVFQP